MTLHVASPEPFSYRSTLKVGTNPLTSAEYRYEFDQTVRLYSLSLANPGEFEMSVEVKLLNPIGLSNVGDNETTPVKIWSAVNPSYFTGYATAFLNPYVIEPTHGLAPLPSVLPKGSVLGIVAINVEAEAELEVFLTAAGGGLAG